MNLLNADVYVMVFHIDNSPHNLCEAMMLGMPCISGLVGGVGSLLKDGVDGMLVQDGDPWVLSGAILELKSDKAIALNLGNSAQTNASQRHERKKIAKSLLTVYKQIIRNSGNV